MMELAPATKGGRFRSYDGVQALRFVAAMLVVVTHSTLYASERLAGGGPEVWDFGAIGVEIFFVISGFVMIVSTIKLVGTTTGWREFGIRRVIRIYPMYWLATTVKLVIAIAIPAAVLHSVLTPGYVAYSYLLIPTYAADGEVTPLLNVGWTLMYEMFFYILFMIALLFRVKPFIYVGAALSLFALGSAFRPESGFNPLLIFFDPIVLYFLLGMAIGQFVLTRRFNVLALTVAWVLFLKVATGLITGQFDIWQTRSSMVTLVGVFLVMLLVISCEPWLHGRVPKLLLYFGAASYVLYLFHPLVAPLAPLALAKLHVHSAVLSILGSISIALIAAAVIYSFVEKPLTRRLNAKFLRRNQAPQPTVTA